MPAGDVFMAQEFGGLATHRRWMPRTSFNPLDRYEGHVRVFGPIFRPSDAYVDGLGGAAGLRPAVERTAVTVSTNVSSDTPDSRASPTP